MVLCMSRRKYFFYPKEEGRKEGKRKRSSCNWKGKAAPVKKIISSEEYWSYHNTATFLLNLNVMMFETIDMLVCKLLGPAFERLLEWKAEGIWRCVVNTHSLATSVQNARPELTLTKRSSLSKAIYNTFTKKEKRNAKQSCAAARVITSVSRMEQAASGAAQFVRHSLISSHVWPCL